MGGQFQPVKGFGRPQFLDCSYWTPLGPGCDCPFLLTMIPLGCQWGSWQVELRLAGRDADRGPAVFSGGLFDSWVRRGQGAASRPWRCEEWLPKLISQMEHLLRWSLFGALGFNGLWLEPDLWMVQGKPGPKV